MIAGDDFMAAGEDTEAILSLPQVAPTLPMIAGLPANHLAALELRGMPRPLYLVRDDDPAGRVGVATLSIRAREAGVDALTLDAPLGDLNEDLRLLGPDELTAAIRVQLAPEDVARLMR